MSGLYDWVGLQSVVTFVLVLFRIAGVFFVAPLLGNRAVPAQIQIAITVSLTILLFHSIKFNDPRALSSNIYLAQLIIQEVSIGVIIGFVGAILFSAVNFAGEMFGMNIGFSIAQIIDPSNEGSSGILTSLYVILGGLLFLYLNGHHVILQALVESFKFIPIGDGFSLLVGDTLNGFMLKVMAVGLKMAAPVMIVMTLLYISFGFITKLSPQLNIYFNVGFVLGPFLGMLTLAISLPLFRVLMTSLTDGMGEDLIKTIRVMKGI